MPTLLHTCHALAWTDALARAALRLREEDRVLMTLFYVERRTLREIGQAFGVHKSTISRRLAVLQDDLLRGARAVVSGGGPWPKGGAPVA